MASPWQSLRKCVEPVESVFKGDVYNQREEALYISSLARSAPLISSRGGSILAIRTGERIFIWESSPLPGLSVDVSILPSSYHLHHSRVGSVVVDMQLLWLVVGQTSIQVVGHVDAVE
jgi:hypothetical protein